MREQNNTTNNKNTTKNIASKPPGLPNELPIRILKREDFPERSQASQETSPRLMVNTLQSGSSSPPRSTSPTAPMNSNNRVSVQILANKAVNIPKEYLPSSPIRSESQSSRSQSPTKQNSVLNPNAAHFVPTKETMMVQTQARYQVPMTNAYPTIPTMYKSYFGPSQRSDKVLTWNKFYFPDIFGNWRTNQSPIAF